MQTLALESPRAARTPAWAAPWWKLLGRSYGHVLHSLCSYMGSFPPSLPRYLIEQFSEPGDVVVDPFSGRGTAPLEACLAGRIGIGVDLNPLAALLTSVKTDPPALEDCLLRIHELERAYVPAPVGDRAPPEIRLLFEETRTLPQLLHLKASLDPAERTDRFLLAALTGILHGHHARDAINSRCLSISMPNTFSMSPGYLERYVHQHRLQKLRSRMYHEYSQGVPARRGRGLRGDARQLTSLVAPGSAKLVITSPPYLNVVRYGKFNWIRLWLLGESVSDVDASLRVEATDRRLELSDRLGYPAYVDFLRTTLTECARVLRDDGLAMVAIGDVDTHDHDQRVLAIEAWEEIRRDVPLHLATVIVDKVSDDCKVSKIWGEEHKGRATKTDRVLVLYKDQPPRPAWRDASALMERIAAQAGRTLAERPGVVRVTGRRAPARPGVVRASTTRAKRARTGS